MPRPHETTHYELTDTERRDLVKLIEAGKPLPEKYRFLLFEDKREVELVWNGKSREVCTTILPFQTLEHIDEPRVEASSSRLSSEDKRQDAASTFDFMSGRQVKGWTNKLIWGDNKLILASLKAGALRRQIEDAGGLKLIYIDPPFDVGADFSMDIEIGGETFHKQPNMLEQIAYRDTWGRGADSFISMIYERLILMRDLLADDGSIYVHCDWRVNSHIRLGLDEIFGSENFRNEIIWHYSGWNKQLNYSFEKRNDIILYYSKTGNPLFNSYFEPYENKEEYLKTRKQKIYTDSDGREYTLDTREGGHRQTKIYIEESLNRGKVVDSVWKLDKLNNSAIASVGYPTQKPEALLERILKASSNEGDLVADFFCGSGTTAAVAEKLGRKWIATDLGKFGIHTTRKRLIQVQRQLKADGKPFRAFEVLNLGRYERQAYLNVSGRLTAKKKAEALARKEAEFRELILRAYKASPASDGGFFHGSLANRLVVVGPINLPVGRLFIEEVITECRKRGATRVDVLAFEFEMGLFPAVLEEAKQKGIDIAPKTIPPEVFDRRAVEKGQVRFADVSYVEAAPRFNPKNKLALSVELLDFSVYYSQGIADAIAAELKAGKSEVVCDTGKLLKLSKDKDGVITRDVLTKKWTDWVDYWAVDFDYESRKEIIKVAKNMGVEGQLPGTADAGEFIDFEERWTGAYIFENEWQSFRTRQDRDLELTSAEHIYDQPGRYTIAIKVIDIFGNDTTTLIPLTIG